VQGDDGGYGGVVGTAPDLSRSHGHDAASAVLHGDSRSGRPQQVEGHPVFEHLFTH